jgi:hypothetical protein
MKDFNKNNNSKDAKSIAMHALRIASALQKQVETKYIDVLVGRSSIDFDGVLGTLNTISQGDSDTSRNGDKISLINLKIKGNVGYGGATTMGIGVRLIIFIDWLNTITSVSDLLSAVSSDSAPLSNLVYDTRYSYKILSDRIYLCDGVNKQFLNFFININLKDWDTHFDSGTTTITKGALKYIIISDVDSTDSNFPTIYFRTRLRFKDV